MKLQDNLVLNPQLLIQQINQSIRIEQVLNISNFKSEFKDILKQIHPDVCKLPGAEEAMQKLNQWKDIFLLGKEFKDDTGPFKTNYYWAKWTSDEVALNKSFNEYQKFAFNKAADYKFFRNYLPAAFEMEDYLCFTVLFNNRSIPISGLKLDQVHVNWVLNRLLEYCSFLEQNNIVHCGLTPESVFIVPETHGIQICSFYHLTKLGDKVKTISGKYQSWYPQELFKDKIATSAIDVEMAKKIAIYLLGDPSGTGIRLRKTHNKDYVNFLLTYHSSPHEALKAYKKMLAENFPKKFHELSL